MRNTKSIWKSPLALVLAALAAGASMAPGGAARADAAAPFSGLDGKWSGDGSIVLTDGTTERLRCNATYVVAGGGANLDQALRCASDSYNFDLRISLVDTAGAILGSWNEVTKNVQGGISGHDSKDLIEVTARGQTFSAAVTVATHGTEQSVKIHADSGDLSQVSMTLRHKR